MRIRWHLGLRLARALRADLKLTLAGAVAALSLLILISRLSGLFGSRVNAEAEFFKERDWKDQQHRAVPTVPLPAEPAELAQLIDSAIEDNAGLLRTGNRSLLVSTWRDHINARAMDSADPYLALASSERTAWLQESDDERWRLIGMRHQLAAGTLPDRRDPQGALRRNFEFARQKESARLTAIGTGRGGCRVIVARASRASDINAHVLNDFDDVRWWLASSTIPARFYRLPPIRPEQILRRDRQVIMAHCFTLVRDSKSRPVVLHAIWYWDPATSAWYCANMVAKGYAFHALEF